jgi:hypothetical protein
LPFARLKWRHPRECAADEGGSTRYRRVAERVERSGDKQRNALHDEHRGQRGIA